MVRRLSVSPVIIMFAAVLLVIAFTSPAAAQVPEGMSIRILSPVNGQQLFGIITITGSAAHPTAFSSYTLEYDDLSDPTSQWFLVQEQVTQQVMDGILGVWNTVMVPDGAYQLRLRVFLTDGQVGEYIVSNLAVMNSQPTPVPTVALGPAAEPASLPTAGPSPTSLIEQPPGNTLPPVDLQGPAAGILAEQTASPPPANNVSSESTQINTARVRSAFCSGVYLALASFAVLLGYSLLRSRLRPLARGLIWQAQDDIDGDN